MNEGHRRSTLRDYVISLYPDVNAGKLTHLEVLKSAAETSIQHVRNDPNVPDGKVTETVLGDLQAVFVGNGLSNMTGRGHGKYWYGNQIDIEGGRRGAKGYDAKYDDVDDQVQHTVGGIIGSHRYPKIAEEFVNLQDRHDEADIRINKETFKIGNRLSDDNIDMLPDMLFDALKPHRLPKPKPQKRASLGINPFNLSNPNLKLQAEMIERNPVMAKRMILAEKRDPKLFGL